MRYRLRTLLIVMAVGLLPSFLIAYQSANYLYRPIFAKVWGRHEFGFLNGWVHNPGIPFDTTSTGVKIDRILNVIVVFPAFYHSTDGDKKTRRHLEMVLGTSFCRSSAETWNGGSFMAEDGTKFLFPRRANCVFVFERSGRRREYPLMPGKATECYEALFGEGDGKRSYLDILKSCGVSLE